MLVPGKGTPQGWERRAAGEPKERVLEETIFGTGPQGARQNALAQASLCRGADVLVDPETGNLGPRG